MLHTQLSISRLFQKYRAGIWLGFVVIVAFLQLIHHGIASGPLKHTIGLSSYEVPLYHSAIMFIAFLEIGRSLRAWFQESRNLFAGKFEREEMNNILLSVLDAAAVGLVITDHQGTALWVNNQYGSITGINARTLIGVQPSLFKWGSGEGGHKAEFWNKLGRGEPFESEFARTHTDGHAYREKIKVIPFNDSQGSPKYCLYFCEDVTEEHKARKRLEERERRHRILIETMNDGLVLTNSNDVVTYANPSFLQMVGYPLYELRGMAFKDLLDDANKAILAEANDNRQGGGVQRYRIEVLSKKGKSVPFEVSPAIVRNNHGTAIGTFAIFSKQVHAAESVARSTKINGNPEAA